MTFQPTYLYIKTHNKTGLKYFGKTTSNDPHKYKGSGVDWTKHISENGYDVTTEIYGYYTEEEKCLSDAINFSINNDIVNSCEWANKVIETLDDGHVGMAPAIDASGKIIGLVTIDDPRWDTGEIVGVTKGTFNVKNSDGNVIRVQKNDPRYINGELVGVNKGNKIISDAGKKKISEFNKDTKFIYNEELDICKRVKIGSELPDGYKWGSRKRSEKAKRNKKGRTPAKNAITGIPIGNVSIDDPRWDTGEIVGIRKDVEVPKYVGEKISKSTKGKPKPKHHIENLSKYASSVRWIYNNETGEVKRLKKTDDLPCGWSFGKKKKQK